jgi:hypothetical protein
MAVDRVQHWLRIVDDPWLHVAATRSLANSPACSTCSTTPCCTSARAAETSRRLGFLQTEAYQLSSLGRAQCQAGDYVTGAATLQLAVEKGRGHRRCAAGLRSPRCIWGVSGERSVTSQERGRPSSRQPRGIVAPVVGSRPRSGNACWPRWTQPTRSPALKDRLVAVLDDARLRGDAPVEVFALDALARIGCPKQGKSGTARDLCGDRGPAHGSYLSFHRRDRPIRRPWVRQLR